MFKKPVHQYLILFLEFLCVSVIALSFTSFVGVKTTEAKTQRIEGNIGTWDLINSPVTDDLRSIAMTSANNGWAVGGSGTILHWNGITWSEANSPTTQPLLDVKMISADNGWAVGGMGTILHWDGISWNLVDSPTVNNLLSIDFISPNEGWAVGFSTSGFARYGTILKWNGSVWSAIISNQIDFGYRTVEAVATDNVWVVGAYQKTYGYPNPGSDPPILVTGHWDGQVWNMKVEPQCNNWINSLAVMSDYTGWGVGTYGCILTFNGGWEDWVPEACTDCVLISIVIVAADDVWVVGGDTMVGSGKSLILHWNGSTWDVTPNPGNEKLWGVGMTSANNGWAVGDGGTILHYTNSPDYQYLYLPLVIH